MRNVENIRHINGNLFQLVPSARFLESGISERERTELREHPFLDGRVEVLEALENSKTVGDLLGTVSRLEDARRLSTFLVNTILPCRVPEGTWIADVGPRGGFRISEEEEAATSGDVTVLMGQYAHISADERGDGSLVFNVVVKSYMRFEKPFTLDDVRLELPDGKDKGHKQMMEWRRSLFLPVHDHRTGLNLVAKAVYEANLSEKKTWRKQLGETTFGEFLVSIGRLEKGNWEKRLGLLDKKGDHSLMKMAMVRCEAYGSAKRYSYRMNDLRVTASTALIGAVRDNAEMMPEIMKHAATAVAAAKEVIDGRMANKGGNFGLVLKTIGELFDQAPQIEMRLSTFAPVKHDKRTKGPLDPSLRRYSAPRDTRLLLLYPKSDHENWSVWKERFLRNWTSPGGYFAKHGIHFDVVEFDVDEAVRNPRALVDRLVREYGNGRLGVVVAWHRRGKAPLPPNAPLEFELMARGINVQHVVDERSGSQPDALKMPAIRAAISAKFSGCDPEGGQFFEDILGPFDAAMSLDVSRNGGKSYPSPAIAYTRYGMVTSMQPTLDLNFQEKRSAVEIAAMIRDVAHQVMAKGQLASANILLIRDGFANEDWKAILDLLPPEVVLTVVSVRKNLLATFSDEFEVDRTFSVDAVLSGRRGIFGVNAALKKGSTINTVHSADVIVDKVGTDMQGILDVLIMLARKNVTLESGICSLPMPQHYADRTAGAIKDFMEGGNSLRTYLRENRVDEINAAGGIEAYIYATIRRFVAETEHGWSWAV